MMNPKVHPADKDKESEDDPEDVEFWKGFAKKRKGRECRACVPWGKGAAGCFVQRLYCWSRPFKGRLESVDEDAGKEKSEDVMFGCGEVFCDEENENTDEEEGEVSWKMTDASEEQR